MNNKKNNRKGFTIVELVIVIAVIAILATVLVPTFGNIIKDARNSAALQEAKNTYTNYVAEYAKTGAYDEDLVIKVDDEQFVAIIDGAVVDTVYESYEAAQEVVEADIKGETTVATGKTLTFTWDAEADGVLKVVATVA